MQVHKCDACGRIESYMPLKFKTALTMHGYSKFMCEVCSIECLKRKMLEIITPEQLEGFEIDISYTIARSFYEALGISILPPIVGEKKK